VKRRTKIGLAVLFGVTAIGIAIVWTPVRRHVQAGMLLVRFEGSEPPDAVEEADVSLGTLRARRYGTCDGPVVLLLHGVHSLGIDEPRFVRFARLLAGTGMCVTTPEIASLREMRFDARAIDEIDEAARRLARREHRSKVGVIGISFGGGLALMAASREHTAIGAVLAIGAHHDAHRLARWWLGDPIEGPGGEQIAIEPERYGAAVLAYAYAGDYLEGVDGIDRAREVLRARIEERDEDLVLSATARARLDPLRGDLDPVRERLRAIVEAHAGDLAAVSPRGRLASVRAPVFLIHGATDPLIASTEAAWIVSEAPHAELAVTPIINHADRGEGDFSAQFEIVHLMANALAAFEALR
jgi:pimeloyl-ACP methyl ester carboxylesterase